MKRLFVFLCVGIFAISTYAKGITETIFVTSGGQLETKITNLETDHIDTLIIQGPINAKDLIFLRTGSGNLSALYKLDLSDVTLIPGGESYAEWGYKPDDGLLDSYVDYKYFISETNYVEDVDAPLLSNAVNYHVYSNNLACFMRDCPLAETVRKVVFPKSLSEVGEYAFWESNVEEVVFQKPLTRIGKYAFCCALKTLKADCSQLEDVGADAFTGTTFLCDLPAEGHVKYLDHVALTLESTLSGELSFKEGTVLIADGFRCSWSTLSITSVSFPSTLRKIGKAAFSFYYESNFNVSTLTFPEGLVEIGDDAFSGNSNLASVSFPSTLEIIGNGAFSGCSELTGEIVFTNIKSIGESAFASCGLTSVSIPNSVTHFGRDAFAHSKLINLTLDAEEPGDYAFWDNKDLANVTIGNHVKKLPYKIFGWCESLKEITIPASVTSVSKWAFDGCDGLEKMTLNQKKVERFLSYNVSNTTLKEVVLGETVETISEDAFIYYEALEKANIPSSVTSIGINAFKGCKKLSSPLTIPSTITELPEAIFHGCFALTSVTLPANMTIIGKEAFDGCRELSSLVMPISLISIGDDAFYNTAALRNVSLPATVNTIGRYAFAGCAMENPLEISANAIVGECAFSGAKYIPSLIIGDGATIGDAAFQGTYGLTNIVIGSNVTIGANAFAETSTFLSQKKEISFGTKVTVGKYAFMNCRIPKVNLKSDMKMGEGAFKGNPEIKTLEVPVGLGIGVKAFEGCTDLSIINFLGEACVTEGSFINCPNILVVTIADLVKSSCYWSRRGSEKASFDDTVYENAILRIPKGGKDLLLDQSNSRYIWYVGWEDFTNIKDDIYIDNISFADSHVKAVCVAKWDTNGDGELSLNEIIEVETLDHAFRDNSEITSFDELVYFTNLKSISSYEFQCCDNLSAITIPKNVTSVGSNAFAYTNIESLKVAEGNTSLSVDNGILYNQAQTTLFMCPPKKSGDIVIPETVTEIASYAFDGCKSITSVSLPSSLLQIGFGAFQLCTLGKISLPANVKTVTGGAFSNTYVSEINVDESNPYFKSVDGALYSKDELTLVAFPLLKTEDYEIPEGTTTIGEYAFYTTKITKLSLPSTITSVERFAIAQSDNIRAVYSKVTTPQYTSVSEYAFNGSPFWLFVPDGTKSLYQNADGWNKRINIREMSEEVPGAIFFDDAKVEALCIAKWDRNFDGVLTESEAAMVTSIYDVFIGNTEIRSFNELKYFTSLQYIHENHFKGCSNLSSVTLPSSITKLYEKAFYGCNFKTFVIPKQIEYVGGGLCAGNPNLEEFIVDSENPTYWTEDGILCQYTTSNGINTPTIVSYPSKRNNKYTIPEGYKLLSYAFFSSDIEEVTISDHVGFSGGQCFGECNKLKVITSFMDSSINNNTFPESVYENATLFVVAGNKEWFEEITGWKNFKHIVEMIDEHDIAITANSYTIEYGEPIPTLEFSCEGGILTGTPTIVIEGLSQPDAGTYPIVISKGTVENPNTTYVNGTLTISKAPLTIKAGTYTRKQGEENPEFTLEYDGFKNDETEAVLTKMPVVTTTAEKESAVGDYEVTVSGAEALNYAIFYTNGTLNVTEADAVIVTAKSYTRVYGDANPTFEFTSSGAALNGIPEVSCTATETSPAGTYDIVIKKGSVTNYNDSYVNGTLTITKAPLTIKAENYTKKRGEENPEFTLTYEGFKNDETEAVLLTQPSATTDATKDSPIGSYVVTVSGAKAQNYEITHVNGTLVVERLISDANNDGKVDEEDLNAIVSHIMGDTPENFDKEAADINGDDKVDAADIVHLVNKIRTAQP